MMPWPLCSQVGSAAAAAAAAATGAATRSVARLPPPGGMRQVPLPPCPLPPSCLTNAGHHPHVELLGVSTVAGNQTVEKTTENALRVLAAAGLPHVPVVAGQARPLLRHAPLLCPEIHGDTGLDGPLGGPILPPSAHSAQQLLPGKAVVLMFERIAAAFARLLGVTTDLGGGDGSCGSSSDGGGGDGGGGARVHLVATGALTNVALLLALYPEVAAMVEVGGGVRERGCRVDG